MSSAESDYKRIDTRSSTSCLKIDVDIGQATHVKDSLPRHATPHYLHFMILILLRCGRLRR